MATTKDRAAVRSELRKNHPDAWVAVDEGDTITGTVEDVTAAWSDVQDQGRGDGWYPMLTVNVTEATGYDVPADSDLLLKVHAMQAVLQAEIIRAEPAPGEQVEITYIGTGEAKVRGRNAPELYRVRVPGRDPKEVAEKVYGSMRHKVRRPGAAATDEEQTDEPVVPVNEEPTA